MNGDEFVDDEAEPDPELNRISYLRITKHKLALLINFNVKVLRDGIKRVAL